MKLSSLLSSIVLASLLIGCGTDEGACCESNIDTIQKYSDTKSKVPEANIVIDNPNSSTDNNIGDNGSIDDKDDEPKVSDTPSKNESQPSSPTVNEKPTVEEEFIDLPPVAFIDIANCNGSYTISCKGSYDTDEDGKGIKQCNWDIVSYDANGCIHKEYQKADTNDTEDAFIAPCEHVKYIEVKLTVIDNEGSKDCLKQKIEVR